MLSRVRAASSPLTPRSLPLSLPRTTIHSYRLQLEDRPTVEHVARHIAGVQQAYTQRGGKRPFGIATFIAGFDDDGSGHLYNTDPSGMYTEWIANATGRNSKSLCEFLEKKVEAATMSAEECTKLAVETLMEIVESGAKNVEVVVMKKGSNTNVPAAELETLVAEIEKEKEAAKEEAKRTGGRG